MFKLLRRLKWTKDQPKATWNDVLTLVRDIALVGLAAFGIATLWFLYLYQSTWNAEQMLIVGNSARDVWIVSVVVGIYRYVWRG